MSRIIPRLAACAVALTVTAVSAPRTASAFCGFYISGADGKMFNNATQVVLMRDGTRTVLAMQNNYQGPPENFAMVIPVPQVLQEENVKTLDPSIFDRVDSLAAPRLVEYWEQDPCQKIFPKDMMMPSGARFSVQESAGTGSSHGVTVEAQFTVGEYEIVILSAKDSAGLDTWLRQEKYQIPEGAEPLLRPYVAQGSKFFVAKVNVAKVKFKDGQAMLSPLRFHYDAETFSLPVRLGMVNSSGTQDLIVHILARGQRYEVANYKNVTIPTNLDVKDETRARFGEFYAALFDSTLEKNPGAVITEYSWDASSCDPCPTPALDGSELATLGEDVLYTPIAPAAQSGAPAESRPAPPPGGRRPSRFAPRGGFVLTRLHARYSKGALADDLVFQAATPIAGGREFISASNKLEEGSQPASMNNFQGRYAIRHPWTGPIECSDPHRGMWGGPPTGTPPHNAIAAKDLAFAPRGKADLPAMIATDIPELGIQAKASAAATKPATTPAAAGGATSAKKEKKGCAAGGGGSAWWLLAALALAVRRRRR